MIGPSGEEGGGLLHNMSQPSRSQIVIPARRQRQVIYKVCVGPEFLLNMSRDMREEWVEELLSGRLGALQREADRRMAQFDLPAAAILIPSAPQAYELDRMLAVAILSRCSPNLFLRNRTPRLTWETLKQQRYLCLSAALRCVWSGP